MTENAQWTADISEVSRCGGMAVMLPHIIEEQVTVWAFPAGATALTETCIHLACVASCIIKGNDSALETGKLVPSPG
jgi:hypothetical protein